MHGCAPAAARGQGARRPAHTPCGALPPRCSSGPRAAGGQCGEPAGGAAAGAHRSSSDARCARTPCVALASLLGCRSTANLVRRRSRPSISAGRWVGEGAARARAGPALAAVQCCRVAMEVPRSDGQSAGGYGRVQAMHRAVRAGAGGCAATRSSIRRVARECASPWACPLRCCAALSNLVPHACMLHGGPRATIARIVTAPAHRKGLPRTPLHSRAASSAVHPRAAAGSAQQRPS